MQNEKFWRKPVLTFAFYIFHFAFLPWLICLSRPDCHRVDNPFAGWFSAKYPYLLKGECPSDVARTRRGLARRLPYRSVLSHFEAEQKPKFNPDSRSKDNE